jgi:hypothetical protein
MPTAEIKSGRERLEVDDTDRIDWSEKNALPIDYRGPDK